MRNPPSLSRHSLGNDNLAVSPPSLSADVIMALRFFSRLPTGPSPHRPPSLNRIAPVLGLVGVLIGLPSALVMLVLALIGLPALLAAGFGIVAMVIVTGAMAEDALADSADGMWGGNDAARRLEIMKDSRHGTYGVLAIVLLVSLRLAALAALIVQSLYGAAFVWLAAQLIARQGALWLPTRLGPARSDGLAKKAGGLTGRTFWLSSAVSGLLAAALAAPFVGVAGLAVAAVVAVFAVWGWTRICRLKVGGFSGDLIGALQAIVEIGVLSSFILFV